MRVYGLTGNIGSGKSTAARLFAQAGIPVIDADLVAREVVLPGTPGLAAVVARFPGVSGADGSLDRKALAARIFSDPAERAALNSILHPLIGAEVARRLGALAEAGAELAIYEAALIVENGLQHGLAGLIVVTAPEEAQVQRLRLREGMDEADARARIAAQLPAAEKAALADYVIENRGTEAELKSQVERILGALERGKADG